MKWKTLLKQLKFLEDSGLLLKGVSETIQNEAKGQKGQFVNMLLGTLGASLQRRTRIYQSWLWIFNEKQGFLILSHPLTNFEIQNYYQNEPRFNVVYSRDNKRLDICNKS